MFVMRMISTGKTHGNNFVYNSVPAPLAKMEVFNDDSHSKSNAFIIIMTFVKC